MSLEALGGLLQTAPQYKRLASVLRKRAPYTTAQVLGDAVPFALATLWRELGVPVLVIAPRPEEARRIHEQMVAWSGREESVLHFPETETLPFERIVSDIDTIHQRLYTLSRLAGDDRAAPVVVASAAAAAQKTIDVDLFVSTTHILHTGQEVDLEDLLGSWRRMGYKFEPTVLGPGVVSRRGGILDVFPVGSAVPARIELWGDEIDSIRHFDPATQRSTEIVDSVAVIPAHETLPALSERDEVGRVMASLDTSNCTDAAQDRIREELDRLLDGHDVEELHFYSGFFNQGSLLDYFPENALLVMCRPSDTAAAAWEADERAHALRAVKERRGELPLRFPSSHLLWTEIEQSGARFGSRLDIVPWGAEDLTRRDIHTLPFVSTAGYLGRLDHFVDDVKGLAGAGHRVIAVTSLPRRLAEILGERGVQAMMPDSLEEVPDPGSITAVPSAGSWLGDGFALPIGRRKLVVFSDTDIFGFAKQHRTRRRRAANWDQFLSELHPGDYVVHIEHGIAKFIGTGRASEDEEEGEYLVLQYSGDDKLYVPLEHLDRVSPYIAPMDRAPALTRLGTQEWKRTKERVERSTREMAGELLSLYAYRELVNGHAFAPDGVWQTELEDSFPFEETPDQKTASVYVKADMEDTRPMDRLVCGDVGYGKTEIALRAAFKAVMDGKQVAVLVPTTVLAQQHYVTFSQRLGAYPVSIDVLSRFRTDKEQRDVVEGLASGKVDICIGTHRLIQKDVRFKDLGLVILDEEQRFGVAHKEHLKQMRREVDVLTLTATPIPRTLHMSLAGVRDTSTIETPPEERLPIKTYVSELSDELIREAILREIDRDGQVFFLHNRVHSIGYMADYIRALVPEAEVGVAHGQMPEARLEQTMIDFAAREFDVLACTTIIESGLDMPNVNTLIINRADVFGLSQLYQLRGRVGRGVRRAYTYLLVPPHRSLPETAEKRLKTMLAATELGAGFRIAMRDLEIRGAGNILGSEQSGYIHAVGFDLYTRLLSGAVEELRAQRAVGPSTEDAGEAAGLDETPPALAASVEPEALLKVSDGVAFAPGGTSPLPGEVSVDLGVPAHISPDYVVDLSTRLSIYHRLARLTDLDDVASMEEELRDRFGPLPWQVRNLLYAVRLRLYAKNAGVGSIAREGGLIVLRMEEEIGGASRPLQKVLGRGVTVGHTQIRLELGEMPEGWEDRLMDVVQKLADFRERVVAQAEVAPV